MIPFIYFFVILEMRVASLWLLCVLLVGVTSAEVNIPMCTLFNRVICSYNCFSSYELFVTCFFLSTRLEMSGDEDTESEGSYTKDAKYNH